MSSPQTPLGDGAQLGRQAEKYEGVIYVDSSNGAVRVAYVHAQQSVAFGLEVHAVAHNELHTSLRLQLAHSGDRRGRGAKPVAAMHQREKARLRRQFHGPIKRRIAAAEHQETLAVVPGGVADAIEHLAVHEVLDASNAQWHGLEGTDAAGDHHGACIEGLASAGGDAEAAIVPLGYRRYLGIQVELGLERLDLL